VLSTPAEASAVHRDRPVPTREALSRGEAAGARAQHHGDVVGVGFRDGEIGHAVSVEVTDRHRPARAPGQVALRGPEGPVADSEQHRHRAGDLVGHGEVSEEIAAQMAIGARRGSSAEVTIAATGIAGPGGGLPHKPVGLVCFAWSVRGGRIETASQVFRGDRDSVRRQTVLRALEGVLEVLPD
jgi:hypothetical protein